MSDDAQRWLPVPDYEGLYEVSDHGQVRSLDRTVTAPSRWGGTISYHRPGRVLRPKRKKNRTSAYAAVSLAREATVETVAVHRLVLLAFRGPCPPGQEGRHLNGDLFDNRLANLAWGTPSENALDRVAHGTHPKAAAPGCPHGHPLVAPNLAPAPYNSGHRRCYACALTQMWGRSNGVATGDSEWVAEANRRHAEILHFGHPLNYRLAANRGKPDSPRLRWQPGDRGDWQLSH